MKQNNKVALTAGHCEIAQSQGLWQPKQLGMKENPTNILLQLSRNQKQNCKT